MITKHKHTHIHWILFVAIRFLSKKQQKSSASSLLSILGIGTGVLALTMIIAVMNGFQLNFIENILEISSYYIRIDNLPSATLATNTFSQDTDRLAINILEEIENIPGILAVVPFAETQGIMHGNIESSQSAVLLRGLAPNAINVDAGMKSHLRFLSGGFFLETPDAVLLGAELAARLAVDVGDTVQYLSITNLFPADDDGTNHTLTVYGVFLTDYYEYDSSWGFINFQTAAALEGGKNEITLGIKLKNRYHDMVMLPRIQQILDRMADAGMILRDEVKISSWRDYNKSFFNALRMEKLLMFVLVGFIFIVVALNIYQAQRRTVLERSEVIGLLRAVGAPAYAVRWAFALKGLFIGLIGATGGMALALFVSVNIQKFFNLIEALVTFVMKIGYILTHGVQAGEDFALFSKQIFYIREYTARLIFHEVLFIYLFAVLSAFFAAWFASARMSTINLLEVLRYE